MSLEDRIWKRHFFVIQKLLLVDKLRKDDKLYSKIIKEKIPCACNYSIYFPNYLISRDLWINPKVT